jgi:hypothetical protein
MIDLNGYELKMTCSACPEQYDVFKDGKEVGYIRLRFGNFTCSAVLENGGWSEEEYHEKLDDEWSGCFDDDMERSRYLEKAIEWLNEYWGRNEGEER